MTCCFFGGFFLPLSLPFDWTFGKGSVLCFVCFEWILCCDVVCENKIKMLITKKLKYSTDHSVPTLVE